MNDLAAAASARLADWAGTLGPLAPAFAALDAGSGHGASHGAAAYLLPGSPPLLPLAAWCAPGLDADALADLGAAALAGYLHVRVLDDRFDEGIGEPETALALASALLAAHHAWVAPHAADTRYWPLSRARWTAFAEAMLFERAWLAGPAPWDAASFDRALDRSRPLVLPGAAALAAAGRWDDVPALLAWGDAVVTAHQRYEDLRDALDDLAGGRRTWLLDRAGARDPRALAAWLLRGGMDEEISAATTLLDRARGMLPSPAADAWIDGRIAAMDAWRRELVTRVLHRAIGG